MNIDQNKTETQEQIILDFSQRKKQQTITFPLETGSTISLRYDSPKTSEACRELGIDFELFRKKFDFFLKINIFSDFKRKEIKDFFDATASEDIIQMRYNHYVQKMISIKNLLNSI